MEYADDNNNSECEWDELTHQTEAKSRVDQKPKVYHMLSTRETHEASRHTHRVKTKGWNKIYWASTEKRKAGVIIMISDKAKV